jgi:hypothetical protein
LTRVDILVRLSHPNNAADESIKTSVEESENGDEEIENGDLLEDKRKKELKKLKRREKKVLML